MGIVLPPVANLKRAALDLLFPRWCVGCGREGGFICGACRRTLQTVTPPACDDGAGPNGAIDGIYAPFLFDGVIRNAIHEFKYRNLRALAPVLAELLYAFLQENPVPGDVLVPVPVHARRLRERGYNQSALLARDLGKLAGLPVADDCLVRRIHTPPQVRSAGIEERLGNVAGAFACRDGRLQGKQVVLIDDVSTSGATLNAGAAALRAAGAAAVRGLVIALEL